MNMETLNIATAGIEICPQAAQNQYEVDREYKINNNKGIVHSTKKIERR